MERTLPGGGDEIGTVPNTPRVSAHRLKSRSWITVLDRPGLEARSCECYQMVKREFDRLLPYRLQ